MQYAYGWEYEFIAFSPLRSGYAQHALFRGHRPSALRHDNDNCYLRYVTLHHHCVADESERLEARKEGGTSLHVIYMYINTVLHAITCGEVPSRPLRMFTSEGYVDENR